MKTRKPIPKDLPRIDVEHDLADEEKRCPCGCIKTRIGKEVSEKLDIIPAKIQVV
ncbi:MAG: IS66 family transposase, partial [Bacteroidetes bacterium]|nr:IS66 family transposase [Bacteroidota bacterium]